MLYYLSQYFNELHIFKYLTFRSAGAAFSAFLFVVLLGPFTVRQLKKFSAVAPLRLQGLVPDHEIDYSKEKTPSMGGILIVAGIVVSTLLWVPLTNPLVFIFLVNLLVYAGIGFFDDYHKVVYGNRDGITEKTKLGLQVLSAAVATYYLSTLPEFAEHSQNMMVPFYKTAVATLPLWVMIGFSSIVVVGSSNAVNLTDGLDGLATGCMIIAAATFIVFAYLCGNFKYASYLHIPYIQGCGEVCVFGAAIVGACLGFLWHNCHPASMFMGDTGSLSLGASIGMIAVLVKQEWTLVIVGGVFVWEASSVLIQRFYFKYTRKKYGEGRRVFLMAPIHHHYQKKGWKETQVVLRFWIIALLCAGAGLATLKIR